jgi:predicted site-specific integrase-resolvase
MKLSDYAKSKGISYQTAWRMWKRGELKATQLPTGRVIFDVQKTFEGVLIYTRVSIAENKSNLDGQAERLVPFLWENLWSKEKEKKN